MYARYLVPSSFRSLVVDHLASNGLLQTLAVFLPESGLGASATAAAALSREDTLQALPIPADSALFRRVISRAGDGAGEDGMVLQQQQQQQRRVCGLLEALVGEVATRSRAVVVDSDTQTEEAGRSHKENLGEREGRKEGGGAQGGAECAAWKACPQRENTQQAFGKQTLIRLKSETLQVFR